jgi:hypothetical protein
LSINALVLEVQADFGGEVVGDECWERRVALELAAVGLAFGCEGSRSCGNDSSEDDGERYDGVWYQYRVFERSEELG